jgi:hypothetical protein
MRIFIEEENRERAHPLSRFASWSGVANQTDLGHPRPVASPAFTVPELEGFLCGTSRAASPKRQ